MKNLLEALRHATNQQHQALHHHPFLAALQEKRLDIEGYTNLLTAFYAPWQLLLPAIETVPRETLKPCLLHRYEALKNDLVELDVDVSKIETPTMPVVATKEECVGVCYVLIGSSLGATQLVELIKTSLNAAPNAYLSVSPQQAGWPVLVGYLRSLDASSHTEACLAAKSIFQLIDARLTQLHRQS